MPHLVSMLATVRRKTGINVQRNLTVPAVSQHAWNDEKEKQKLMYRGILWYEQCST